MRRVHRAVGILGIEIGPFFLSSKLVSDIVGLSIAPGEDPAWEGLQRGISILNLLRVMATWIVAEQRCERKRKGTADKYI